LDSKLRLWSIPDKSVAFWVQVPDLITAVAFAPDGKTAIAGCLTGLCLFYETEGLKYQTQIHVRSAHGKNAKGSKVTGIETITYPPNDPNGDVKLLITSNDSRVRIYNLRDKGLEMKLKGNENTCSQIHASFSDDAKYVICGSEDRKAYIWSTSTTEFDRDRCPVETFEAHSAIVTTAIMAPIKTRQLLSASGDPLYDLCNPPPVTLISRSESHSSSKPPSQTDNRPPDTSLPMTPDLRPLSKPGESPAYIARSAHPGGNIIVTADYMGHISVFRQDCAYQKRLRSNNDASFSRKMLGRSNSVATRNSTASLSSTHHPSTDRIMSWRQSIGSVNGSFEHPASHGRSISPRKSLGGSSLQSSSNNVHALRHNSSHPLTETTTPSLAATSPPSSPHKSDGSPNLAIAQNPQKSPIEQDPLLAQGDQSYMFGNRSLYRSPAEAVKQLPPGHHYKDHLTTTAEGDFDSRGTSMDGGSSVDGGQLGVPLQREMSTVSALTSEESLMEEKGCGGGGGGGVAKVGGVEVRCRRCGEESFKARKVGGGVKMECVRCGAVAGV